MKKTLLFILLACVFHSLPCISQTIKTDTVVPGFFIPPDTNVVSFNISSVQPGQPVVTTSITGNKIPAALIDSIGLLPVGSSVTYEEITVLVNGKLVKSAPVRYMIGLHTTAPFYERGTNLPVPVRAQDLAQFSFGASVVSFTISFQDKERFIEVTPAGNQVPFSTIEKIKTFEPGKKVFFEKMTMRNRKGQLVKAPGLVYIVSA